MIESIERATPILDFQPRCADVRRSMACCLLAVTLMLSGGSPLWAQSILPQGGAAVGGSATVGMPANTALTITQTSPNAIVNWNSFSIGQPNMVIFNQPNSNSAILNRVTGDTPSAIAGALRANGQVYLVNPNGIAITPSGAVEVGGGFVASTLGISNEDFMGGKRTFTGNGGSGPVGNAGRIDVGAGGFVALLGGTVSNEGRISVPLGRVGLGSGESVTLDIGGDGFMQVAAPTVATAGDGRALIEVSGRVTASGGTIELKAASVKQAIRDVVNVSGRLSAHSASERSGAIVLDGGEGGEVVVAGRLNASADPRLEAADGGAIMITGDKVAIVDGARIRAASNTAKGGAISVTSGDVSIGAAALDASGATGGGDILIGGGPLGAGALAHARAVDIASGATLRADATRDGAGGAIVAWSDGTTRVKGLFSARGAGFGEGGLIETSGHNLDVTGIAVNASAALGVAGTWLLDPYNLTVGNAASTATQAPAGTWTSNAGGSVVLNTDINAVLDAGTNVVLQTSGALGDGFGNGDITISSAITKTAGGNANFSLLAGGSIIVNAAISSTTGALGVTLNSDRLGAGGYVNVQAPITTNGGALIIGGGANPLTGRAVGTAVQVAGVRIAGALSAGGGDITINGSGFNSAGNNNFGINQVAAITNTGTGSITLNGVGGGVGNNEMGVISAANITADTGNISITGAGSPTATFLANHGVRFVGATTSTSGAGSITIDGTATGVGTGVQTYGVVVQSAATVRAADGLIKVTGHNNATGNGLGNNGVYVTGAGSKIVSTGAGGVTITGFGGGTGTGGSNHGVFWNVAEAIQSTGSGAIAITGVGGGAGGAGVGNFGVNVNAALTAIGGPITITGTGGGAGSPGGSGGLNTGVNIGAALAGSGGAISITGVGGNSRTTGNAGISQLAAVTNTGAGDIRLNGAGGGDGTQETGILSNANITAGTGDISITGAASTTAIGSTSYGVQFLGGTRSTTGAGTITIVGAAEGAGAGANTYGVSVRSGAVITAVDGLLSVSGVNNSTGAGGGNTGVNVTDAGSTITSTGGGGVTVTGVGGGAGSNNYGVAWNVANGIGSTGSGAINIVGSGGGVGGSGGGNNGVNGTAALTGNGGAISITGTPSNSTGGGNFGISLGSVAAGVGALTLSSTGDVTGSGALAAAQLNLLGAGGSHTLTNAGNAVTTLSANTGSVNYAQTGSLSIGAVGGTAGVTTTAGVSITTAGDLTIMAGAPVSGVAPTLAASGAFLNNAGSSAVTSTSGRWLIYSSNPTADTFGDLNSNSAAVWNKAANAAVAATGNRYVFAVRPTLTFSTVDATKVYGANGTATVAASYAVTGLQSAANAFTDTAAAVYSGEPSVTSAGSVTTASVASSPYVITAGAGTVSALSDYVVAFASTGRLSVTPAPLTVTANAQSRVYGDANPALTYLSSGLVNGDTLTGGLATSATTTSDVGAYPITQGTLAASPNYTLSYIGANLTVTPAALTVVAVTANPQSRVYGAPNPALTYVSWGLVNGDTLTGDLATSATTTSNVGAYPITQGTLAASSNYALSYIGANLTVTPAPLTVTANAQSRVYGAANPALTYVSWGLVNGDTLTGGLATSATTTSNVGAYPILQGTLAASPNYTLSYIGANLTVTPARLTVTANARSRVYGAGNPALTYVSSGLVNGDTLTGGLATSATTTSNVGAYPILQGMLAASPNYTLSYIGANLTVTPAGLTVTANAQSRVYGAANPALTYVSSGLVNGDTLTGGLATSATTTSNVGAYPILQGTLAASPNYTLSYIGANLTVTPAVTARAQSWAFPSHFSPNDFVASAGDDSGFEPANSIPATDESTCTPAGISQALNRYGRVDLTGGQAAACEPRFSQVR